MINPFEMMKNLQNIQAQAEDIKNKLAQIRCTGYAMGNMVEAVVTGDMKIVSLKIDPSLVKEGQEQFLEVLVTSAINNAFDNVRARIMDEARKMGLGV